AEDAVLDAVGMTFRLRVAPHADWTTRLDVRAAIHVFGAGTSLRSQRNGDLRASLDEWLAAAPGLSSDWRTLELAYERSLIDLAALRFYAPVLPGMAIPAAGLPWFMTVFGRDSLITAYQALPYAPELAEATLRVLAARQGSRVDDFRDEEPGKILHEIRVG